MALSRAGSYNQQALEASKLMYSAIGAKAQTLKQQLPKGRIVIEIAIETIENEGHIHRVAAIALENDTAILGEGKLRVNVSVHKYQELHLLEGTENPLLDRALARRSESSDLSLSPQHYTISSETMTSLAHVNAEEKCPNALRVVKLLQEQVFPRGIPLPHFAQMFKCHLIVMTKADHVLWPSFECVASHDQFVGEERFAYGTAIFVSQYRCEATFSMPGETKMGEGFDWNEGVKSDYQKIAERFEILTDVAKGTRLPSSIPVQAIGVSASTEITVEAPAPLPSGQTPRLLAEGKS